MCDGAIGPGDSEPVRYSRSRSVRNEWTVEDAPYGMVNKPGRKVSIKKANITTTEVKRVISTPTFIAGVAIGVMIVIGVIILVTTLG